MKKEKDEEKVVELPKKENTPKGEGIMNKQIITLLIGILIGVIITVSVFLITRIKPCCRENNLPQYRSSGMVRPNLKDSNFNRGGNTPKKKDSITDKKEDDNTKTDDSITENKS